MTAATGILSVQKWSTTLKATISNGMRTALKMKKLIPVQKPKAGSTKCSANRTCMGSPLNGYSAYSEKDDAQRVRKRGSMLPSRLNRWGYFLDLASVKVLVQRQLLTAKTTVHHNVKAINRLAWKDFTLDEELGKLFKKHTRASLGHGGSNLHKQRRSYRACKKISGLDPTLIPPLRRDGIPPIPISWICRF